jgi:hypothetical protein
MKRLGLGIVIGSAALSLYGCGVPLTNPKAIAAVADTALPPPSVLSPLAQTRIDDRAVVAAFKALGLAATAADTVLALKPSFAGTPAAVRLADGMVLARTWLNIASKAQRAQQADSYVSAMKQAVAALSDAQAAMADLKGAK